MRSSRCSTPELPSAPQCLFSFSKVYKNFGPHPAVLKGYSEIAPGSTQGTVCWDWPSARQTLNYYTRSPVLPRMCLKMFLLWILQVFIQKKRSIRITLHHKNQPIITKQFSGTATIDNCLTIKVDVEIYNSHNCAVSTWLLGTATEPNTSCLAASNTIRQFIMMHISYYLLIITYQWKRQHNYIAHLPLANKQIQTFLSPLANPLQKVKKCDFHNPQKDN